MTDLTDDEAKADAMTREKQRFSAGHFGNRPYFSRFVRPVGKVRPVRQPQQPPDFRLFPVFRLNLKHLVLN